MVYQTLRTKLERLPRWMVLVGWAVLGTSLFAAYMVVPAFVSAITPPWLSDQAQLVFLNGILVSYALALLFAPITLFACLTGMLRARNRAVRLRFARGLLLSISILFCLGIMELGAAFWQYRAHRAADLERIAAAKLPPPPPTPEPEIPTPVTDGKEAEKPITTASRVQTPLKILVVGESSARGEPYQPWLSMGQILGWKLEQVLKRPVSVDVQAFGGMKLEGAYQKLEELTYRPDVILLFCGHNEYQATWAWTRTVDYYDATLKAKQSPKRSLKERVFQASPLCGMVLETLEKFRIQRPPDPALPRRLVDSPTCSEDEHRGLLESFRIRLGRIARFCERLQILPIFVITASNDADFEPSRSILPPNTSSEEIRRFARAFFQARALAHVDLEEGLKRMQAIVADQPGFAEGHYRLAKLLATKGDWAGARTHFIQARELDAMPMRAPERFRQAYRDVAAEHPSVLLVDSPRVLEALAPHGILGDGQFHDAQHPNMASYAALATNAMEQLAGRGLLGWPKGASVPPIDLRECAQHFGIDQGRWATVCYRSSRFYEATSGICYDPVARRARCDAFLDAELSITQGVPPESVGLPGVGVPRPR